LNLYEVNDPDNIILNYNACYNVDTTYDDLGFIGQINQVNANGDSCDAGFNIFLDPQIVSLDSLDFHLYLGSPLIDAGNPDSTFNDVDGSVNDIGLYGGPFGESYEYPEGVGESDVPVPEGFTLARPYPNPFNSATIFTYTIPFPDDVQIKIYDTIGRLVFEERLEGLNAGTYRYTWQGVDSNKRSLSTGIYYFELTYQGAKLVMPVVMLK